MSRYIDADKYRKDLLSAYDDVSMEFEVLDRQPLVQAIPLEKVKQAREEIENRYDDLANAWCEREEGKNEAILDVLEILDKLIEEVEE